MKKYDTIIFDMDGTLLDTLEDLTDSINYMLNKYSYPTKTIDQIRSYVGNGIKALVERAIPDGAENPNFDEAYDCFLSYYEAHSEDKTKAYAGVCELIEKFRQHGYKMAIVSNKFDAGLKVLAKKFFPTIEVAIGESAGVNKKPAPDMVFAAMNQLGSTKEKSVYIGDSDVDFMTAKNSGIDCVSVLWGFRTREFLSDMGATVFAETPDEVFDIVNG